MSLVVPHARVAAARREEMKDRRAAAAREVDGVVYRRSKPRYARYDARQTPRAEGQLQSAGPRAWSVAVALQGIPEEFRRGARRSSFIESLLVP